MVIYTGYYTKIMQKNYSLQQQKDNSGISKRSGVHSLINRITFGMTVAAFVCSLILLILMVFDPLVYRQTLAMSSSSDAMTIFTRWLHFLVFNLELVPISLFIYYDAVCFLSCLGIEKAANKLCSKIAMKWYTLKSSLLIRFKKRPEKGSSDKKSTSSPKRRKTRGALNTLSRGDSLRNGKAGKDIGNQIKRISLHFGFTQSGQDSKPSSPDKRYPSSLGRSAGPDGSLNEGNEGTNLKSMTTIGGTHVLRNKSKMNLSTQVKIINYSIIPDMGSLTHVIFDKTDTLTTSNLEIKKLATTSRCYHIESEQIVDKLIEIKTPGNNLDLNDSQDENKRENSDYSEKSQEYQREIDGEYQNNICDEDSTWTQMIRGLEQPSYDLEVNQEGQSNLGSGREDLHIPNSKDASFQNDSMHLSKKRSEAQLGHNQENDSLSPRKTEPGDSKRNMKNVVGNLLLERKKSLSRQKASATDMASDFALENQMLTEDVQSEFKSIMFKANREYPFQKFIRDTHVKREDLENFFSVITLLNRFTLEGERNTKAQAMEDKAVSDVLKNLGFSLSAAKKNKDASFDSEYRIKCSSTGLSVDFRVVGVNFFSHLRDRLSIVYEEANQTSGEAFLLVKGSDRSMQSLLKMPEKDKNLYRELVASYKSAGLKQIVYGIKKLSHEKVMEYRKSYIDIQRSSRDQMESYENLAIDIEKDLHFIGCFGVRDNIVQEAYQLTRTLKNMGLKISILSGDSRQNCLNVANTLQITNESLDEGNELFKITSVSTEKIATSIKRIIDQIHEDLKNLNQDEMKVANEETQGAQSSTPSLINKITEILSVKGIFGDKKTDEAASDQLDIEIEHNSFRNLTKRKLLLRGDALDLISSSNFLLPQFKTILLFCDSIIGYQMQPSHKACIVNILQQLDDVVMAVGDGFNDIGMIREANIGVQVANYDVPVIFSDILVSDIGVLEDLMLQETFKINRNSTVGVIVLSWICFTMTAFQSLLYYHSSQFSELFIKQTKYLFFYFLFIMVLVGVHDKPYRRDLLKSFPILYSEHLVMKKNLSIVIIGVVLLSLVESVLQIWVMSYFTFENATRDKGFLRGIEQWESCMYYITFLSSTFKVWMSWSGRTKLIPVLIVVFALLGLLPQYFEVATKPLPEAYSFFQPSRDPVMLTSSLVCIIGPSFFNWYFFAYMHLKFFSPLAGELARESRKLLSTSDNKDLKKLKFEDIKQYLTDILQQKVSQKLVLKYRVTPLIKAIIKINKKLSSLPGINKIVSIDLFNYQVGLNRISNYIKERVERSRFRDYLTHMSKKKILVQFYFYLVCYICSLAVGLLTPAFRRNYMLDTTVPYMIIMISFLIWVTGSSSFSVRLHLMMITFGVVSLLLTTLSSVVTMNRFELNTHDFYSIRIWYSLVFDMIDSSILVLPHLLVRILTYSPLTQHHPQVPPQLPHHDSNSHRPDPHARRLPGLLPLSDPPQVQGILISRERQADKERLPREVEAADGDEEVAREALDAHA